jgi:hypothetical protein
MTLSRTSAVKLSTLTLFLTTLSFSGIALAQEKNFLDNVKVIYGEDSRVELEDFPDAVIIEHGKSVAGMVQRTRLTADPFDPTVFNFPKVTAEEAYALCPDERFKDQPVLPICSGFLVAPDLLVTAGHCVEMDFACERFTWVFGYTEGVERIARQDVYNCKEIVEYKLRTSFAKVEDYAVIRLDRPVTDRAPLTYRKSGRAPLRTGLVVVGHPMGLPLKAASEAKVTGVNLSELRTLLRSLLQRRYYFHADLDTYGGNSGSPVFNRSTGVVEGILIEGAEDFEFDDEQLCLRSSVRSGKRWSVEERVMRITRIPYLKKLRQKQ